MGLDNYPMPCPCGKHRLRHRKKDGLTHAPKSPCPFKADDFPIGIAGTCCALRGKAAAYQLEALGESDLGNRMYEDMTAEEALSFADELRSTADRLEQQHANDNPKPHGVGTEGRYDEEKREWVWTKFSTFEQALARIRQAAAWYEKVARLGYGVHTWY